MQHKKAKYKVLQNDMHIITTTIVFLNTCVCHLQDETMENDIFQYLSKWQD